MATNYSIKLIIRDDKPVKQNGKHPLYFLVRLNKHLIKLPTGKEIQKVNWDKGSVKAVSGANFQLLNSYLGKKIAAFDQYVLRMDTMGKPVTKTVVKNFFKREGAMTFYQFFEDQIQLWIGVKKESTIMSYKYTLQILKEFNPDLNFGDIDVEMIERLDKYLRLVRKNKTGGTFGRHKCLKTIIKIAIRKDLLDKNPYDHFKIKLADANRAFLSVEEIKKLKTASLPEDLLRVQTTRETFLFACYTGLRFSDIVNLKWSNIKENPDRLEIVMEKTGKEITIPIIPLAKTILMHLKKEAISGQINVFKAISNQVVNRNLKELMIYTGIKKKLTFHSARNSFACNHIEADTHILYLKDLLGHSDIGTTQIYAKSLTKGLYESMNKLSKIYN
ncbi:MAG: site-specific integrase [Bacteroidetes bacterium]|nr:site-specific integrase [Bacteroidota bacterium]HET6245384.1 site-specific integrase [Bacteroidia bacterium]